MGSADAEDEGQNLGVGQRDGPPTGAPKRGGVRWARSHARFVARRPARHSTVARPRFRPSHPANETFSPLRIHPPQLKSCNSECRPQTRIGDQTSSSISKAGAGDYKAHRHIRPSSPPVTTTDVCESAQPVSSQFDQSYPGQYTCAYIQIQVGAAHNVGVSLSTKGASSDIGEVLLHDPPLRVGQVQDRNGAPARLVPAAD